VHLLAAKPGGFNDDEGIIDLQQSPAEIIILSAQDTSLALLSDVADELDDYFPTIRLANIINLNKPTAFDLYEDKVLQHARVIIVSVLGGKNYWSYGIERLVELAELNNQQLILIPGDDVADNELFSLSTTEQDVCIRLWRYLREGGKRNAINFFNYIVVTFFSDKLLKPLDDPDAKKSDTENSRVNNSAVNNFGTNNSDIKTLKWEEPRVLPHTLIYSPGRHDTTFEEWQTEQQSDFPVCLLLFYRSHLQSGNTQAFDDLITALNKAGLNVLALATNSLKDSDCLNVVNTLSLRANCSVIINTTSFSQSIQGNASLSSTPQVDVNLCFESDTVVIQAIMAANSYDDWQQNNQGLHARDIAMNIALPEYDGRIISRAVSFKEIVKRSERTQIDLIRYQTNPERAGYVAELTYRWALLKSKPNSKKRIGLILANYPTNDSRIGNGVGLDTPASVINILKALLKNNYPVENIPLNGDRLIEQLLDNVTNDADKFDFKDCQQSLSLQDYQLYFDQLPEKNRFAIIERWGLAENDPKVRQGRVMISGIRLGQTFIGIQPARGFNIDLVANYHDPDLVPPHNYLAFYFWLRHIYQVDAVAHIGKHGNLEWLPGKSVGLSKNCWPDLILGPLPHLYPFIVNDPGEGAQAKRRNQAVILDHLMPPMGRAESYGELLELENYVDEFYQALGIDPRREEFLRTKILQLIDKINLAKELNLNPQQKTDEQLLLNEVDAYLCELKEAQIRNGLHIYGRHITEKKLVETLVSLIRLPRGEAENDIGILHALVDDLDLKNDAVLFDPLNIESTDLWQGAKPECLQLIDHKVWRTHADTRERLELYAQQLVTSVLEEQFYPQDLIKTTLILKYMSEIILEALQQSATNEIDHFIQALNGRFVPPGPSGAPTRGRLDVLPTGRNFYSIDNRAIPTRSAWELGQQSAELLVQRYMQEHGDYPEQLGISVWGTSTMRTGGDDIAQAFALMGVRPVWATASNRVVDIEIIPGMQLNRPRVDVTLRISGFFRDAFPNVARLFDTAVKTLASYEEPAGINRIRQHIENDKQVLREQGLDELQAQQQSQWRVFGSKPGSYGAGLQGLIDEGIWDTPADLAKAYVNWGGYVYSQDNFGGEAFQDFESRLKQLNVVIQNQDNREHDLLDSDDYYQFQGGMTNAVHVLKGEMPEVYHGDHSNPSLPKIKTLKEELNKVIRSRVVNPKWIKAMQQHGYKGAFEMAASVDYLFAYDATTSLIDDYQYEMVSDALLLDEENREFLQQHNPNAMKEMSERLLEAQQRGLWQNPEDYQQKISDVLLEIDKGLELAE